MLVGARRPDLVSAVVVAEGNLDPGGAGMSLAIAQQSEDEYVREGFARSLEEMRAQARASPKSVPAAAVGLQQLASPLAMHRSARSLVELTQPTVREQLLALEMPRAFIVGDRGRTRRLRLSGSDGRRSRTLSTETSRFGANARAEVATAAGRTRWGSEVPRAQGSRRHYLLMKPSSVEESSPDTVVPETVPDPDALANRPVPPVITKDPSCVATPEVAHSVSVNDMKSSPLAVVTVTGVVNTPELPVPPAQPLGVTTVAPVPEYVARPTCVPVIVPLMEVTHVTVGGVGVHVPVTTPDDEILSGRSLPPRPAVLGAAVSKNAAAVPPASTTKCFIVPSLVRP